MSRVLKSLGSRRVRLWCHVSVFMGLPGGSAEKNRPANVGDVGAISGSGRLPWRRKWQPLQYSFLPGKLHGQRNLAGYRPWGCERVGHDLAAKHHHPLWVMCEWLLNHLFHLCTHTHAHTAFLFLYNHPESTALWSTPTLLYVNSAPCLSSAHLRSWWKTEFRGLLQ